MGTKNISLPRELEEFVDDKVASGEYAHASEVVRDGLRLMMQADLEKLEWLRNAIREGMESETLTEDEAFQELKRRRGEWLRARQVKHGA
ncbi:MAG TPA: type II toxin-antitoxin system ParD family antitoxin [Candidatus Tyrphobacter sp.]